MVIYQSDELPEDISFVDKLFREYADKMKATISPAADEVANEKRADEVSAERNKAQNQEPENAPEQAAAPPVSPNADENSNEQPEPPKRNCGRTGPVTPEGKSKVALNSLRHGTCSKTLILPGEKLERWLALLANWEAAYPGDSALLHDFITRTAQAEWFRIRAQQQYDDVLDRNEGLPELYNMHPEEQKRHELQLRYLTAAQRNFQREYRMLETFYEKNGKREKAAAAEASKPAPEPTPEPAPEPKKEEPATPHVPKNVWDDVDFDDQDPEEFAKHIKFLNVDTGEFIMNGQYYPGPPDWVPEKITPGVYPPYHIANWKYKGDPKDRFKKKKQNKASK